MAGSANRDHGHSHPHSVEVVNRLARVSGHLGGVKRMVEEGEDCAAVLQQVSAVIAAMKKIRLMILEDHFDHCLLGHVGSEPGKSVVKELKDALRRF